MLIIKQNLLPWYDELNDKLIVESPSFPKSARKKLEAFGDYELDFIDEKESRFEKKAATPKRA